MLMAEVTGIVNSCPIAMISTDPEQPQLLSPNSLFMMKTRPFLPPPGVFMPKIYTQDDIGVALNI